MATVLHQGYVPGCIGRVAELHATYYSPRAGFGLYFESKVARELAAFCEAYQEGRDGLWLVRVDGRVEGSLAIDGSRAATEGAHLRWFIASDAVRGTGPVALNQPHWFLVLFGVSILFVLHSKGKIRVFTDRLETGEVVTACKFLAIAGVVLPLIPSAPLGAGLVAQIFDSLPVTPRQIWMAVVITTTISYLGYVLQTYLFPRKGLLLTGLIGGVYSSTVAVLVLAKKSKRSPGHDEEAAAAILLAVSMMYLRLLVLVAIFRFHSALQVGPALVILALLAAAYGIWIRRNSQESVLVAQEAPPSTPEALLEPGMEPVPGETEEPALRKNPLEINSALFFAFMFVAVSLATKYALILYQGMGLRMLSFVVGCSDITPFVVSVLQGNLGIGTAQVLQAIIIASASNNMLKVAYTYMFGTRRTANLAAMGMVTLAALSVIYAITLI